MLVLAAPLAAQMRPGVFEVTSDRVLVNAVVMDRHEHLVTDLEAKDFRLSVDRAPAEIDRFWREDAPVSAVIVFDASGSMSPALSRGKEALRAFFRQTHPEDEYALVLCKQKPTLQVPFTTKPDAILAASALTAAKGSTPLYDALELALQQLKQARHHRKVIFVISDGQDNSSRTLARNLKRELVEADAYLYAVEFWTAATELDESPPAGDLSEFAELTGGVYFGDVTPQEFVRLLGLLDIHQQYVMTFRPRQRLGGGKYHPVELRLAASFRNEKLQLYWRHGYYDLDEMAVR